MAETYENYHKPDIKLPFRLKHPDGTYINAFDPKTGKKIDRVDHLTPEEVLKMKGMGYQVEPVEPKPDLTHINLSQTKSDRE
ncbi:MAG TPA: hypothetical protein VLH94_00715 [Spirochaetia bacterium]|nr:hypothetical protein [Spirochaetia bacterium]